MFLECISLSPSSMPRTINFICAGLNFSFDLINKWLLWSFRRADHLPIVQKWYIRSYLTKRLHKVSCCLGCLNFSLFIFLWLDTIFHFIRYRLLIWKMLLLHICCHLRIFQQGRQMQSFPSLSFWWAWTVHGIRFDSGICAKCSSRSSSLHWPARMRFDCRWEGKWCRVHWSWIGGRNRMSSISSWTLCIPNRWKQHLLVYLWAFSNLIHKAGYLSYEVCP